MIYKTKTIEESDSQRLSSACRRFIIFSILIIIQVSPLSAQSEDQLSIYPIPGFVPVFEEPYQGLYWHPDDSTLLLDGAILPVRLNLFQSVVEIDSSGTHIIFRRLYRGDDVQAPTILSIKDYYLLAKDMNLIEDWDRRVEEVISRERERGRGGAIEIVGATIAGQDVALRVTGNINIRGGIRNENRSTVAQNFTENQNTSFKLVQKQQFNIEGTIGDKISILVDQDSERDFEFENALKIRYIGDEDEIIKRIDAGNIDLSLPGTRFAVSGGRNQGLFGLKSLMKVGGLNITSIISVERGKKAILTLDGGATSQQKQINDYGYVKNTYFFLDDYYRRTFYPTVNTVFRAKPPNRRILTIDVYITAAGNETGNFEAIAVPDPNDPGQISNLIESGGEQGRFKRLTKNIEYEISENHGFIRMNTYLSESDILAVAYIDQRGEFYGGQEVPFGNDTLVVLKLLKSKNQRPSHPTWNLEFKNVYNLGATNINKEGFDLKIVFDRDKAEPQERDSTGTNYLQIFGLDSLDVNGNFQPDQIFDIETEAIINLPRGELWFPSLRPFFAPEALNKKFHSPVIYNSTWQDSIKTASKFKILVSYKNRSSVLNLGINVIEGSEEVTLDGVILERGTDYSIDYFTGQLTLLKEGATDPGANLEVRFEKNQLFQLDKKSLLGTRAEYRFGENSYLGGTFLYYSKSTIDQKVRVGEEPIRNMLWDLNGRYDAKPNFITRGVNALPLIKTDQPSSFNVEGEIARIIPNPNTLNSKATGDNRGVAYLDDFESSKRVTSLSITRRHWRKASPPDFKTNEERGYTYWYNPFERVFTTDIWEDRDLGRSNQAGNLYTDVLTLNIDPTRNQLDQPDSSGSTEQKWGGVMRALPASFFDQTQTKFLEIWVKGNEGRLSIDIGHISEDANADSRYDTEDEPIGGTIGNNLLDEGEDTGVDGCSDINETGVIEYQCYNSTDANSPPPAYDPSTNPDPNADNWQYDPNVRPIEYRRINGTEGNQRDEGGFLPDTEDLNGNTFLDIRSDYFEYSFWLDGRDDHLIAGGRINKRGWRLYRLPITEYSYKSGQNVTFQDIQYIRIWVDGLTRENSIQIATIELVANEWQELGVMREGSDVFDKSDSSFAVTVVNTEDNSDIYDGTRSNSDPDLQPPPGVTGVEDRITRVRAKEQSLVLSFDELAPGAVGAARKVFFQDQDIARYGKLKMFVHGDKHFGRDSSSVEFFIRLGRSDESYYEISGPVYPGWDSRNHLEISLAELTNLKLKEGNEFRLSDGKRVNIVNSPSITRLRQIVVGVRNKRKVTPISGQIWLDELRVSDISREGGIAARGSVGLKIADVGNVNVSIDRVDADFHKVEEKAGKAGVSGQVFSFRVNNTFKSNKLLPARWGLSIPISVNFSRRVRTPKYLPGTDILVQGAAPDSIKNINSQSTFGISFKKNSKSRSKLVKYTLDKSSANLKILNQEGSNSQVLNKRSTSYNGGFSYNLPIKRKSKIKPFFWTKPLPWLGTKLANERFNYYPNSFTWSFNATESKSNTLPRRGLPTESYLFNVVRNLKTGFPIFRSFNLNYGRGWTNDLSDLRTNKAAIYSGDLGTLLNANESFSAKWNPRIFSWMQTNFGYNSNYRLRHVRQRSSNDISNQKDFNTSLNFDLKKFMALFDSGKKKTAKKPTSAGQRRRSSRKTKEKKVEEDKKEAKKERDNPTIGELLGMLSKKLQPVNISYSTGRGLSNPAVIGEPNLGYKFGFSDDPGVEKSEEIVAENTRGETTNFTSRSGLNLSRNITLGFSYGSSERKNRTSASNLNTIQTRDFFPMGDGGEDGIPFPSWNLRISGLEKLPLFSNIAKSVSLEHGFGGKENKRILETIRPTGVEGIDTTITEVTGRDFSKSWQPLIGMSFGLKKNITANFRYNKSTSTSNFFGITKGTQILNSSNISITANYSRRGGMKIPIFFLRDFKFDNQVSFSLTYNRSTSEMLSRTGAGDGEFALLNLSKRWTLQPQMSYSFSSKLNGGLFFEFGKTETIHGTTSFRDFGLTVNIAIRG